MPRKNDGNNPVNEYRAKRSGRIPPTDNFFEESPPGFGLMSCFEDCSIAVSADPGCLTVTFSTLAGDVFLVIGPDHAKAFALQLLEGATQASKPEPHLSIVKAK